MPMGSTGESDRKRRQFNTISPTAATAKKQPFLPSSEDKKLDTAVLQFQNQKLFQKLEAQKAECSALQNKFYQLKERQQPYDTTIALVNESWNELVDNLESCSVRTRDSKSSGQDAKNALTAVGEVISNTTEDTFLSRLVETGATESCSTNNLNSLNQMEEDRQPSREKTQNILCNIVAAISDMWSLKDRLCHGVLKGQSGGSCRQNNTLSGLQTEVKNLRMALSDLHLNHKLLAREMQSHRDTDAKNKAELKWLTGELEITVAELEEINHQLAALKVEKDSAKAAFFPLLNLGSKNVPSDKIRDKQKDVLEMESTLKDLQSQSSSRLLELKGLHEERTRILHKLSSLQNTLKNVAGIASSRAYILARDQLEKSKAEVLQYQALYEKLQFEKDNLSWREREVNMKTDLADVFRRSSAVSDSRITQLGMEIQIQINNKNLIESKLEEATKEPGRKEIISEFKELVSSFPKDMGIMQSQLSKYKEAASDLHSLRADMQSLSNILGRKAEELETLSARSIEQDAEMQKLQAALQDLKESEMELKLILQMYSRESIETRDVMEAKDLEYKAWAHVQSLKSCLDEHRLELRVKTANEAEAISQQRLATSEAEIAELRHKLDMSQRDKIALSEVLKSKHEEIEAYLSEIETIGQAYDDMQTQNQHLLQQITERDDYNIKLVIEGVRAKQVQDALLLDKQTMEKEIHQAQVSLDFYDNKATRIEEQLRFCSGHVQKLAEDRSQNIITFENAQKRLLDVKRASQKARDSLEESQSKIESSRVCLSELQIEIEMERFKKKRMEEELDIARKKLSRLRAQTEGSSMVEKLQEELKEYKDILKCSICVDKPKEVVITKCYHLFCNSCVQRVIESRQRRCPACSTSFGANDVKPVYI